LFLSLSNIIVRKELQNKAARPPKAVLLRGGDLAAEGNALPRVREYPLPSVASTNTDVNARLRGRLVQVNSETDA